MENDKERKGFVLYALRAFLIAFFFIIATTSLAISASTQLAAGSYHTVGLKTDGTVVAVGLNNNDQLEVSSWSDIVQVAAGNYHTVGLKTDGTVVAVGDNGSGRLNVESWSDIAQVSAGHSHTVGLKNDGTLVAVGSNNYGQISLFDWDLIDTGVSGDLNGDGAVGIDDYYDVFLPAYGTCADEPGYDPSCNFDDDDCVTLIDIQMFYQYYLDYLESVMP